MDVLFAFLSGLLTIALIIFIWWKIFDKAGLSAPLSILMIIPLVNVIMLFYFALSEWPILRELRALRTRELEAEIESLEV